MNLNSEIIKDLILDHLPTRNRQIKLYDRYKASNSGVPIFTREVPNYEKINNRLNNDFFSEIIDTKIGYFLGKPIIYNADSELPNYEEIDSKLQSFLLQNSIDDLDSETAKMAAICGVSYRLLYIDKQGEEKVMNIPPWEVITVMDRSINEIQYVIRYYPVQIKDQKGNTKTVNRVEWYDSKQITFFIDKDGEYVLDDTEPVNPRLHMFDPILEFANNKEKQGDCEKVLSLIDGYDKALSDINSELEQFRLAYMLFYGMNPDSATLEACKQTGAFGIEDADGAKIEFLTKQLNDAVVSFKPLRG